MRKKSLTEITAEAQKRLDESITIVDRAWEVSMQAKEAIKKSKANLAQMRNTRREAT